MKRVLAVFNVPDDTDKGDLATQLDLTFDDADTTVWDTEVDYLSDLEDLEKAKAATDPGYRPTTTCGCGHTLVWVDGHWQHDVAPYIWGDDHDADEPPPPADDPQRLYWDIQDGVTDDECVDGCGLAVTHDGPCRDKPGGRILTP